MQATLTHDDTRRVITLTDSHNNVRTATLSIEANRALRLALAVLGAAFQKHDMMSAEDWRMTQYQILHHFWTVWED